MIIVKTVNTELVIWSHTKYTRPLRRSTWVLLGLPMTDEPSTDKINYRKLTSIFLLKSDMFLLPRLSKRLCLSRCILTTHQVTRLTVRRSIISRTQPIIFAPTVAWPSVTCCVVSRSFYVCCHSPLVWWFYSITRVCYVSRVNCTLVLCPTTVFALFWCGILLLG